MKLSILIPTLPERNEKLQELIRTLSRQTVFISTDYAEPVDFFIRRQYNSDIEILILSDKKRYSIGWKRNMLLKESKGKYVCFIDDDDMVCDDYLSLLMDGIDKFVDCCSLRGEYWADGNFDGIFEHSIKYNAYKTVEGAEIYDVKYERFPNHLNCIKSTIAKKFRFPEKNFSEDTAWATEIFRSGLIETEHYIDKIIYYYNYVSKK